MRILWLSKYFACSIYHESRLRASGDASFPPPYSNRLSLRRFPCKSDVWKCNRHRTRWCSFLARTRAHSELLVALMGSQDRPFPVVSLSSVSTTASRLKTEPHPRFYPPLYVLSRCASNLIHRSHEQHVSHVSDHASNVKFTDARSQINLSLISVLRLYLFLLRNLFKSLRAVLSRILSRGCFI